MGELSISRLESVKSFGKEQIGQTSRTQGYLRRLKLETDDMMPPMPVIHFRP